MSADDANKNGEATPPVEASEPSKEPDPVPSWVTFEHVRKREAPPDPRGGTGGK